MTTRIRFKIAILLCTGLQTCLLIGMDTQNSSNSSAVRTPVDSIITFFIRPCFCSRECIEEYNLTEEVKNPGFMNRHTIRACLKNLKQQGINVVYYGMATHSDAHGQITFPRKHTTNDALLVITNKPKPVLGQGVTVNRWVVGPDTPVAVYHVTQQTIRKQLVWHIQKMDIPQDRIIPIQAIVIIADPNEIIIHEGISSTVASPSLILPTLYTKNGINLDLDELLFLNINRYFSLAKKVVNYSKDRYARMVQP